MKSRSSGMGGPRGPGPDGQTYVSAPSALPAPPTPSPHNDHGTNTQKGEKYDPAIHHRRSIRLKGYDYSQAGAYFVTICTQNREYFFGEIANGEMQLNAPGRMISRWYSELENIFPDIECDAFVCMPNHVHFIAVNVGADLRVRPDADDGQARRSARTDADTNAHLILGEHAGSPLHRVVQWFKTMSTNEYIRGVKQNGWRSFPGKLWQRNYWEHIVRNESELNRIREYIHHNPTQWELDKLFNGSGQTHRSAPTEIREPIAEYDTEAWMV
ncbi:transposase [Nitrosomonas sp. ANs5]|uniref:transposase n=1 Tax=Nitrosomonas sp. ANs5 TaxID=3423941 RepID=UPI003D34935D